MKYTDWKLINEAMGPGTTPLSVTKPNFVSGPIGSRLPSSEDDEDGEEDFEDEDGEEDFDDEDLDGPEDDFEDDFETDDSESDIDEVPPEEIGGEAPPDEIGGEAPPDEMDDTLSGIDPDLAGLGSEDDPIGGMGDAPMGGEMGDAPMGDEMGDDSVGDIPCPKCNPDGEGLPGEGDPNCPDCNGENFTGNGDDLGGMGDDLGGEGVPPEGIDAEIEDGEMPPVKQCNKCASKFMSNCECTDDCTDDFMDSLRRGAQGQHKRVTEIKKNPQAGQVGFAPQDRVGSIGGGYTMDDFKEIPVLGESFQYLTFEGWMKKKNK